MPKKMTDSTEAKPEAASGKKAKTTTKRGSSRSASKSKPIKRSKTFLNLPLVISEELREAILSGEIPLGGHLKQEEIAKRFNSSLIPVREALRTLETEGLITMIPNRGAVVSMWDPERVRQRFETRIFLEVGAMRKSVPHLTDEELARAEEALEEIDRQTTAKGISAHNQEFHHILISHCDNPYLMEQINMMHRSIDRYLRYYLSNEEYNRLSQEHHHKILEAAKDRDGEGAAKWVEIHLREALDHLEATTQIE
ncbi:GntR family transcriptional regulator [Acidaminobacter hydrogenoformans]|uniref:DNA-binding transcriptional regulator, GntR family n=1 Tax=Acidaminobacter hydrogenoformans DSM 2784 TaxID=1120920 RepID=A0A1G5RYY9_9FIRM|nr:GntR family transcriptional regulator [Acidaminobacter hydrogenoformans]SCZ79344.1 DNA-binding transcriptional regulator, GntR family [Acidaminobacter hydrogenoformans DSM 2784]